MITNEQSKSYNAMGTSNMNNFLSKLSTCGLADTPALLLHTVNYWEL